MPMHYVNNRSEDRKRFSLYSALDQLVVSVFERSVAPSGIVKTAIIFKVVVL